MPDYEQGTPEWWLSQLGKELSGRSAELMLYDRYYSGDQPMLFATEKFREAFGGLFRAFSDSWCQLVVDAVEERLNITGFRLGPDLSGDTAAWAIWQRNQLDAYAQIAHTEALINGQAYALVWWDETTPESKAKITVEHPLQMTVRSYAGTGQRAAALKRWLDDDGYVCATLYLPQAIYKWRSRTKPQGGISDDASNYVPREVPGEPWPLPNKLGVVPVVPLRNRTRLLGDPQSEIANVIPIQDAVNKLCADLIVASEYMSFRQRWATGLDIPRDPETKQPIEAFKPAIDRLWHTKAKDAKFGEFSETSLQNYVSAIEMFIQHIASQTRTPPHYFYLRGTFPSGESIKSAETGLVAKARRKMTQLGEAWEEVISLAFAVEGEPSKASVDTTETIWADPESRTEGEHVDAVLKRQALGVPQEQLWEDAGYSPTQIDRFKKMLAEEPMFDRLLAAMKAGRFTKDLLALPEFFGDKALPDTGAPPAAGAAPASNGGGTY